MLEVAVTEQRLEKKQQKRKRHRVHLVKRLFIGLLLFCLLIWSGYAALSVYGQFLMDHDKIETLQNPKAHQGRLYIPIQDMPDYVWEAFLAVEDHRFMHHIGVDPISMARAAWTDLKAGAYVQGGSTITMQLARNLYLTDDKTMMRKFKEIAIAFHVEREYNKKQILEMYLNYKFRRIPHPI
ncbi:transglycosylase domain-containing protein [Camelliibacillus cellulosilyticus]|uniref:Transglycosylase domain-containing protein n=1 Tax=Camelliibacillus cellulosilyticus TaxID=2174486 RepID=A0ABV9GPA1_9BACL